MAQDLPGSYRRLRKQTRREDFILGGKIWTTGNTKNVEIDFLLFTSRYVHSQISMKFPSDIYIRQRERIILILLRVFICEEREQHSHSWYDVLIRYSARKRRTSQYWCFVLTVQLHIEFHVSFSWRAAQG